MPSDHDAAAFLAGSPDRLALLESLGEGPASPAVLADRHDVARRSVQRNLAAFVERGWARSTGGTYHRTVAGALVADEHAAYLDRLGRIGTFDPFYRHLPDREHAPDPAWLADATLVASTEADPQAPVHAYVERVRALAGDRVRMLAPVLSRLFHEAHASLARRGVHTDLVMPAAMVAEARERNPLEFRAVVRLGVLDLYRHPEGVDLGLTLGADAALLLAYDDERTLRALVETADPRCRDWAAGLFERYREESTRVGG